TRANIDEFTQTTARAIESVGVAERGKAIIILNPAEPPLIMRDTVHAFALSEDEAALRASIAAMVARVQSYVPGHRPKQAVQFERYDAARAALAPGVAPGEEGLKVTVLLEVEGAAHYLPSYTGNLDIMTAAALRTAEDHSRAL